MKNSLIILLSLLALTSCSNKMTSAERENLPKDISLKTENNLIQQAEQQQLKLVIKGIDSLIQGQTCENPADWAYTAIGAKPCGGPASYIAYPKNMEEEILPQIKAFTSQQNAFNKKYKLMSDCIMVPEPHEIRCVDGKAVLAQESLN